MLYGVTYVVLYTPSLRVYGVLYVATTASIGLHVDTP